jgi:hypothetical protein
MAQWVASDSVLAAGELGVETDTGKVKVGDGVTNWTGLGYLGVQALGGVTGARKLTESEYAAITPADDVLYVVVAD